MMKGVVEELGEEVDESVDSISKVQTQILNLTSGKVNIFDSNGEFRDYYDIMMEIADVVKELSSTDRAQLYEILFGKNRMNQGAAMLQAFQSGQIQEAYQTTLKSAGSAMAEQSRWSQSLEARLKTLGSTWEEVSQTFLDSDFLKGAVDTAIIFLETIMDIHDAVGLLNIALAGTGIAAFSKNFDCSIEENIIPD